MYIIAFCSMEKLQHFFESVDQLESVNLIIDSKIDV